MSSQAERLSYPRVDHLLYRVEHDRTMAYVRNAWLDGLLDEFTFKLADKLATFTPRRDFRTPEYALAVLTPQLRSWELHADLTVQRAALRFVFVKAVVTSGPAASGEIHAHGHISISGEADLTVMRARYPAPPYDFAVDGCVSDLAEMLFDVRSNPRLILKNAYSFVTRLEYEFDGIANAATRLQVSQNVLRELRKLSTTRGAAGEARKFDSAIKRVALAESEREWIVRALETILFRVAADAASASHAGEITVDSIAQKSTK